MISQLHRLPLELIPGGAKKDLSAASRLSAATTAAGPISALSVRAQSLSALQSRKVSAPEASLRAMADPSDADDRGGEDQTSSASTR